MLAAALLLCSCRGAGTGQGAPAQTAEESGEGTALPAEELRTDSTPAPTPAVLRFPDGSEYPADTSSLDLSSLRHEDVAATAELLRQMAGWGAPEEIDLGSDGTQTAEEKPAAEQEASSETVPAGHTGTGRDLTWEDIRILQEAAPQAELLYRFSLFGKELSTLDEVLDFRHVEMEDGGAAVREILPFMRRCRRLDMDFCGVSSENMAEIRDAYPEIEVIWRIWFGADCSVRTDTERILASNLNHKLTDDNTGDLKYCTRVRFLDVGHNEQLHDFSFLEYMPDLEVALVCITGMWDLTPLADHKKLEYLEINTLRQGMDLTPLGSCDNLQHLNACYLGHVQGWEALKNLKHLQRLWFGSNTFLPDGALEELQAALPDTVINTTNPYGSNGDWRYDGNYYNERYELLRQQFEYDDYTNVSSSWYNDPLYYKEGESRYYPANWW